MSTTAPLIILVTNSVYGESNYEQLIWEGASRAAKSRGACLCALAGGQISQDSAGQLQVPFLFRLGQRRGADAYVVNNGTIAAGVNMDQRQAFIDLFRNLPLATTAIEGRGALFVGVDNFSGMKASVRAMVTERKARRIAYVSGPYTNSEAAERLRAYKEVLKECGIVEDPALIHEGTWVSPSGANAIRRMRQQGTAFDAVVAANDLMAIDVLEELQRQGIAVPDQVAVSGFDDIEGSRFTIPRLTTVYQPIDEMSERAVLLLLDSLGGKASAQKTLIPARLVLRESSQAAHAAGSAGGEAGKAGGDGRPTGLAERIRGMDRQVPAGLQEVVRLLAMAVGDGAVRLGQVAAKALRQTGEAGAVALEHVLEETESLAMAGQQVPEVCHRAWGALSELRQAVAEFRLTSTYEKSTQTENVMNALILVNRSLNQVGSLEGLEGAIATSFVACGIKTCHVMLFAEGNSANARRVASIVDGRAQGAMQNGRDFPAEQLLERGFGSDEGLNWVICPLSFESQQLGFVAFVRSDILSFIYEALANQLSAVLHSLLLIRQIEAAELAAANQATRISDLVRPMIETIGAAGALAREQGSTMAKLVSANAETARRLGESERHVEEMQQDLKRIIALTGTIDDLSETINVIAINAAIAAARAGSDGKVFGVISSEIRRLSVQTKTSTAEISSCLSALSTNSESFFDANGQTREVFSHLEEEIRTLLGSLESIQASMSDMTGKAQLVLATMGERK